MYCIHMGHACRKIQEQSSICTECLDIIFPLPCARKWPSISHVMLLKNTYPVGVTDSSCSGNLNWMCDEACWKGPCSTPDVLAACTRPWSSGHRAVTAYNPLLEMQPDIFSWHLSICLPTLFTAGLVNEKEMWDTQKCLDFYRAQTGCVWSNPS